MDDADQQTDSGEWTFQPHRGIFFSYDIWYPYIPHVSCILLVTYYLEHGDKFQVFFKWQIFILTSTDKAWKLEISLRQIVMRCLCFQFLVNSAKGKRTIENDLYEIDIKQFDWNKRIRWFYSKIEQTLLHLSTCLEGCLTCSTFFMLLLVHWSWG